MANVSTDFKRGELKVLARAATKSAQRLKAVLEQVMDARHSSVEGGSILIQAAGNGSSAQYQIPSDCSPGDVFELCNELDDRHDAAKAALIADGTEAPSDAEIIVEMLARLQVITEATPDFSAACA